MTLESVLQLLITAMERWNVREEMMRVIVTVSVCV